MESEYKHVSNTSLLYLRFYFFYDYALLHSFSIIIYTLRISFSSDWKISCFSIKHYIITGRKGRKKQEEIILGIYSQQTIMCLFVQMGNSLDGYEIIYQ